MYAAGFRMPLACRRRVDAVNTKCNTSRPEGHHFPEVTHDSRGMRPAQPEPDNRVANYESAWVEVRPHRGRAAYSGPPSSIQPRGTGWVTTQGRDRVRQGDDRAEVVEAASATHEVDRVVGHGIRHSGCLFVRRAAARKSIIYSLSELVSHGRLWTWSRSQGCVGVPAMSYVRDQKIS